MYSSLDFHLRADSSQITDTLLPRLGGDEGVELVRTFHNGDPASVRETAEVATELKQAIFHLSCHQFQIWPDHFALVQALG